MVIDANGNLSHDDYKRMGRRGVMIGFTTMRHMLATVFRKAVSKFPLVQLTAVANAEDLHTLAGLIESGKLKPQIEKVFSYKEIPAAISYIEAMRTRGKVVMQWLDDQDHLVSQTS